MRQGLMDYATSQDKDTPYCHQPLRQGEIPKSAFLPL